MKTHRLSRTTWSKEVTAGNIFGPCSPSGQPDVHINRFGVIPKKYQPGKWRLITDLSYPEGTSVNDAIDPALCSLTYTSVDEVAAIAAALGRGAQLAKIDVKSAYRLVPVHPGQRHWLGMQWQGKVYIDGMLPFGLRSAPKLFNAVADALEWCVVQQGVRLIYHYLDDYVVLGSPGTEECGNYLFILQRVCHELGVPLAPEKQDGPAEVLTFLGIEINTIRQELRLPVEKLQRLLQMVNEWERRKACTRRELESLIGILQHACKVIRPGRSFLRRAISLLSITKQPHHHIRLNAEFRSDIRWWKAFETNWNGTAIMAIPEQHSLHLTSDASGSWGCGAWHATHWFQLEWAPETRDWSIAAKVSEAILCYFSSYLATQHVSPQSIKTSHASHSRSTRTTCILVYALCRPVSNGHIGSRHHNRAVLGCLSLQPSCEPCGLPWKHRPLIRTLS